MSTFWQGGFGVFMIIVFLTGGVIASDVSDIRSLVESDWGFQESQKGRTFDDPKAILDLQDRAKMLWNDLGQSIPEDVAFVNGDFLAGCSQAERESFYKQLRWKVRNAALNHPLIKDKPLLFVKRNRFACQMLHEYLGYFYKNTGISGGEICLLENPGFSLKTRSLTDGKFPEGVFETLSLSYNAKTIYFAFAGIELSENQPRNVKWTQLGEMNFHKTTHEQLAQKEGKFHLYSMSVDGSCLKQLTDDIYDDFDPTPLPDGGIGFLSTRRGGFVRCNNIWEPLPVYTLHRMNEEGGNLRTLSFHETNEWHPFVLNDGRIIYSRWDYVDRSAAHYHGLWTSSPDGTQPSVIFGNYTQQVSACYQPHAIPGSQKIMFVAGAHHAVTGGSLVILDPTQVKYDAETAEDSLDCLERITPDVAFPETPNQWPATYYHSPWPLSENYYFVSYSREPLGCFGARSAETGRTGLYYLDRFGNRELLYEDKEFSAQYPIPLTPRLIPPVIPDRRDESLGEMGEFYLTDVNKSFSPLPEGRKIQELRVFQLLPKGPDWTVDSPRLGHAYAEGARLFLGTVPVDENGSAYFTIPANKPVYFQAVDTDGKAVQTMRSAVYLQNGERRSCVGCHESPQSSPESLLQPALMTGEPHRIKEGPDGTKPFSYVRLIQPILDQKCVSCHDGNEVAGHGKTDLTGEQMGNFSRSYESLRPYLGWYEWGNKSIQQSTTLPGRCGSTESPLTAILNDKHHKTVGLSNEQQRKIDLWLDANVPFYGVYEPEEQEKQRLGKVVALPELQ